MAGELDDARACASDVLDRLGDRPDAVLEGMAREALGLAALQTGDLAEADRQFTRAEEINDLVHNREPANQRFQADHAEAVIGIGDLDRAERLVGRSRLELRLCRDLGSWPSPAAVAGCSMQPGATSTRPWPITGAR